MRQYQSVWIAASRSPALAPGCRGAIGGQRRLDWKAVGRHSSGEGLGGDLVDRVTGCQEQSMLVGVRADHEVDTRPGPGSDAIKRRRGDDVPVDHRLPRQQGGHYLSTPALWVGIGNQIGLQFCLGRKQVINGNRCDRLSSRLDPKLLGKAPATRRAIATEITL